MTAVQPPTYYFSGINFNSAYYTTTSSGSGLTQAQANALYLQKTTPDIATALESFNAGIYTNTIDSLTNTGTISIGTARNETALTLGKTTYSTTVKSNILTPLKVTYIDVDSSTPTTLNIGGTNTNQLNLGSVSTVQINVGNVSTSNNIMLNGAVYACSGTLTLTNDIDVNPVIDTVTALPLYLASYNATQLNMCSDTIPCNILGNLTLGAGANTIQLNTTGGINRLLLSGSAGTSGQVLTSGGSGTLSWTTVSGGGGSTYQKGTISTPSTSGSVTFSTPYTGTVPIVLLTPNSGSSGTAIVNVAVAGVTLTGFSYIASGTASSIFWLATQ